MSIPDFLTTKTLQHSRRMSVDPPKWTNRGDGFNVEFAPNEKLPLHDPKQLRSSSYPVFRWTTDFDQTVVVKSTGELPDESVKDELREEVKILQPLRHYHCIRTLGCYTREEEFGIVMQPYATCDLEKYLSTPIGKSPREEFDVQYGPPARFLPKIMGCLAHALQYIHEEPMVRHRDIKPANILLDGSRVLFADFGLSKTFTITQTGTSGDSKKTPMVR